MAEKKNSQSGFQKFVKKELKGAAKKESYRQEKRAVKKETEDYFRKLKKEAKNGQGKAPAGKAIRPAPASPLPEKPAATQPRKKITIAAGEAAGSVADAMPLNKYIAWGGICSRRDAAELVKQGKVKVNGKIMLEPSYKVQPDDDVVANGKKVVRQKNLVYILLNKPKDYLTTAEDDKGRKTVMDIVKNATEERIYPVGRLDRNTTGVLLLTNDGDLAQQLTHPKFEVKKIYEVRLDKAVTKADLDQLVQGITLEDGPIAADAAAYADTKDKSVVGVEIHSGRNRIVRRMFEHLGYDVKNLDRVMFANLTKKNVDRGKWRFLNDKEIRLLKYFNKSKQ
jgi:23S rRNA pseudouridine2605 synthase